MQLFMLIPNIMSILLENTLFAVKISNDGPIFLAIFTQINGFSDIFKPKMAFQNFHIYSFVELNELYLTICKQSEKICSTFELHAPYAFYYMTLSI